MSSWDRRGKYRGSSRGLHQRDDFDRQAWAIYAVVVALALVTAATYLLPR